MQDVLLNRALKPRASVPGRLSVRAMQKLYAIASMQLPVRIATVFGRESDHLRLGVSATVVMCLDITALRFHAKMFTRQRHHPVTLGGQFGVADKLCWRLFCHHRGPRTRGRFTCG